MKDFSEYRFPFAAFPALRIALLLAAGIVWAHYAQPDDTGFIINTGLLIILVWAISEFILREKYLITGSLLSTLSYLAAIILFGAFLYTFDHTGKIRQAERMQYVSLYSWETVHVKAEITERGWTQAGREVFVLKVRETELPEGITWHQNYKLRAYGNDGELTAAVGSKIEAEIRLYAFPEARNPHDFDYGQWLIDQSIYAHGELTNILAIENRGKTGWGTIREYVEKNIDQLFDANSAPVAKALFLGYKQELEAETRQAFSRAGLSHIMAVSGLHVGFIVAPFWLIIPWLWQTKRGKWIGLLGLTVLLLFYAGLTGFSASVSRASLMAWLLTYGKLFHKLRNSVNLTAAAAIILLLLNPERLFDIGFQLSFSAVFIILLVMPEVQRIIPQRYRYGWIGGLAAIVIISIIVQGGLFPVLTYYFGEFSIVGPIANALVVPLLSVIIPSGLFISVFGRFMNQAAEFVVVPVSWSLTWIESVASYFGSMDFGYLTISHSSFFLYIIWLIGVLAAAAIRIKPVRWKMLIGLLLAVNLFLAEQIIHKPSAQYLKVTVLDVGQGDAVHIKTPGGKHLFVDTGRWSPMGNSGERVLLPYLEYKGIQKIDAVFLSHPHADHIGGLPALMESVEIETIYHSEYPYDSRLYKLYNQMAANKGIPVRNVFAGDIIEADPALRIFVMGPRGDKPPHSNPNNHSVVLRIQYGETSFLFTGDAETHQERELTEMYGDFLDTNFLKAGHHGSRTSSTPLFVAQVSPEITAVSLAFRNQFRHPNREAVTEIYNTGAEIDFTSLSGALVYKSDGKRVFRK